MFAFVLLGTIFTINLAYEGLRAMSFCAGMRVIVGLGYMMGAN